MGDRATGGGGLFERLGLRKAILAIGNITQSLSA
jgi:hypothetical protein